MKKTLMLLLLVLIPMVVRAGQAETTPRLVTKEESLGKLLPGAEMETLTTDPAFKRVAYVVKRETKELAVVDGVEGKEYDHVGEKNEMYFSPDGKRLAYVAKHGDKALVVVDGKEDKEYDSVYDLFNPIFSPDSRHVAYIATTGDRLKAMLGLWALKDFAVEDGQEGKPYELVEELLFSPDSKKLAYLAQRRWNQEECVVVNGVEGKQYDGVVFPCFSPDSSRLAYVAHKRIKGQPGTYFAVIDGKKGEEHSAVGPIIFSPDSKHTAYPVGARLRSRENFVVRDDVPGKNHRSMQDHGNPVFSPDSQRMAYVALDGTNWIVLVDGKVFDDQQVREFTQELVFSPDSQHLAYSTRFDTPTFTGYDFAVVDGVVQKQSKDISTSPYFSPDGKRLAYLVRRGEESVPAFDERGGKSVPVYGEFEGKEYDRFLTCDPSLNIQGVHGKMHVPFVFDQDGALHAIVLRGDELFRLELKIEEK